MHKLIRVSTVPMSLNLLLKGQLAFLNKHFLVSAVSSPGKDLKEVAKREGIPTFAINMERGINLRKDLKSLWKLYRFFKKEKPDIVHSITPKAGLLSMAAAYFAGVPIRLHTFTGLIFPTKTGLFQKLLITLDRGLCLFATRVYPEGTGVKRDLIKYKITRKPLEVLANGNVNGIDTSYFDPENIGEETKINLQESLDIAPSDFVFVFVGRLVRDKGVNELISAFRNFSICHSQEETKDQTVKLVLVGPYESDLDPLDTETIEEIQNNKNIISVGFQTDIRPFLSISDVLVFPSYREGFPNVVLQAGAMGLPAIVSDINGCNEIVSDRVNGLIIPSRNVVRLQEAMEILHSDDRLRLELKAQARRMICQRYQQELVWEAVLKEYQILLGSTKHSSCN